MRIELLKTFGWRQNWDFFHFQLSSGKILKIKKITAGAGYKVQALIIVLAHKNIKIFLLKIFGKIFLLDRHPTTAGSAIRVHEHLATCTLKLSNSGFVPYWQPVYQVFFEHLYLISKQNLEDLLQKSQNFNTRKTICTLDFFFELNLIGKQNLEDLCGP